MKCLVFALIAAAAFGAAAGAGHAGGLSHGAPAARAHPSPVHAAPAHAGPVDLVARQGAAIHHGPALPVAAPHVRDNGEYHRYGHKTPAPLQVHLPQHRWVPAHCLRSARRDHKTITVVSTHCMNVNLPHMAMPKACLTKAYYKGKWRTSWHYGCLRRYGYHTH